MRLKVLVEILLGSLGKVTFCFLKTKEGEIFRPFRGFKEVLLCV